MKSNFELADELGRLAIETIKNTKMQNKILTNLKMLFDNRDYRSLPNPYDMGLEELGMLQKWHYEAGQIITQHISEQVVSSSKKGQTNREIANLLGVKTSQVTKILKQNS
jgi:DNA-binding MarR family transcriptional regulator